MRAGEFESLFASLVAGPAAAVGFERWGKGLWFESAGLRAAVLRTELRNIWPFEFTLVVGHDCLRDFEDRVPAPRSRDASEWPVKLRPSVASSLLDRGWQYKPYNLGRYPADVVSEAAVEQQLTAIASEVIATFPSVINHLTPTRMIEQLRLHGDGAWCESRWLEDYATAVEP